MTSAVERYVKAMNARFGYFANWLPNEPLALGDVGTLDGKLFRRETSLSALGIGFDQREDGGRVDYEHTSGSGLRVGLDASVHAAVAGTGETVIDFTEKGGFVFVLKRAVVRKMDDLIGLGSAIMAGHRWGKWKASWFVVTTVVEAETALILVSNSSASQLVLRAAAPAASLPALAEAHAGTSVATQSGSVTRIMATEPIRPLFHLHRVKPHLLFEGAEFRQVMRDAFPLEEVAFGAQADAAWPEVPGAHA